jgi:glycyl-tRNA synthetase beta chain
MNSVSLDKNFGTFILEIGVEEIPATQIEDIANHIKLEFEKLFSSKELFFKNAKTFYSARRLFFEFEGLQLYGEDKLIEIKGPPSHLAFQDGKLSQAALGFLKKNNLSENQITEKNSYMYASFISKGIETKTLLENGFKTILESVPGERFMRWGDGELKFIRPIEWISCRLISCGKDLGINLELAGIRSSVNSHGHRFLGGSLPINTSETFLDSLRSEFVLLNQEERKSFIVRESEKLAETINAKLVMDEDLLEEVTNLLEYPCPILCSFDESFLKIPQSVLITVMTKHQRYFPLVDKADKILPNFIAISNNPLEKARENIRRGNEKVIVPRFKDAEFFVLEDMQIKLEDRLPRLKKINSSIGNMLEKSERIEKITGFLIENLKNTLEGNPAIEVTQSLDADSSKKILRAAKLCKTDLTTHLVFEFTELQGEVGGVYASRQGEAELTAKSIEEHYLPRFAGDRLGASLGARLISIADRVDTLVCAFALGKIPKGSADPFALRRQANGLLELILHSHLILNINELIDFAVKLASDQFGIGQMKTMKKRGEEVQIPEYNWQEVYSLLKDFLKQRLEFVFQINHKDLDINQMVLNAPGLDPLEDLNKKHMLIHYFYELKKQAEFEKLMEALKRISNILKNENQEDFEDPEEELFENEYEKNLFYSFKKLEPLIYSNWTYASKLETLDLIGLIKPINLFFDKVLVNVQDIKIKAKRINLLRFCKKTTENLISLA